MRRARALLAVALVSLGSLFWSASPAEATTVFTTGIQVNGPVVVNSDGGHIGVLITGKQNSSYQLFEVDDYAHNPIFSVPPYGGPAVLGDNFRIFAPTQIFGQAATLWMDGSLTLGQVQADGSNQGGVTFYSGAADPNVSPPAHAGHAFNAGDRYFRSNGATYVFLSGTWTIQ